MSERIIKLQSQQAFNETWKPASETPIGKLIDFTIPANGTYDLGKSYININMETVNAAFAGGADSLGNTAPPGEVADDTALYNNDIVLTTDQNNTDHYNVSCSALVRNADLFSQNKGMVESIRAVNKLRSVLWNLENDGPEMHGGLDKFGTFQGRRGVGNSTASMTQIIGSNVNVAGTKDLGLKAQKRSRDFRIPLSDLFGVGNVIWNGNYFGDTQIHLEVTPNLLRIEQMGGAERTSAMADGTNFGQQVDYTAASGLGQLAVGNVLGSDAFPLVSKLAYKDFGLNYCFYVGQAISVEFDKGSGAEFAHVIIDSLEYNSGTNSTNPPNGNESVRITTRTPVLTAAGTIDVESININALLSTAADDQIRINKAELVLNERMDIEGPEGFDYRTYSTEETQGNSATQYNKQIIVEANAQNLIICNSDTKQVAPDRAWTSYRLSIDNEDVCGNRDVVYNKPLHRDRVLRFFQNRGEDPSNLSFRLLAGKAKAQQANANQIAYYPICETLPLTERSKTVSLELNSAGAEDICFIKELVKSI